MIRAFFICVWLGLALLFYAALIEPRQTVMRAVELGEGDRVVRIALVTDIHIGGPHVPSQRVKDIVARINDASVDMTLLPGDFIDGHTPLSESLFEKRAGIADGIEHLTGLNAPAFASIGNHDVWYGVDSVAQHLRAATVRVLRNEGRNFGEFCIVGIDDPLAGASSATGFADCASDAIVIALMHTPDVRHLLRSDAVLAVAGHTHGGQVNLPILGRRVTSTVCGKPCAYGLIQTNPDVYVSAGIGTSILPIRFRAPPEIVIITLRY